jgi:hypothetical protein
VQDNLGHVLYTGSPGASGTVDTSITLGAGTNGTFSLVADSGLFSGTIDHWELHSTH